MLIFIRVLYLGRTGMWAVLESPLMSKQYGDLRGWKCSSFFSRRFRHVCTNDAACFPGAVGQVWSSECVGCVCQAAAALAAVLLLPEG